MGDEQLIADLKTSLALNQTWSRYATVAILAGIIIEFVILFIFSHGISWKEKWALATANLLIAGGLYVEYDQSIKKEVSVNELQRISDVEAAKYRARAAVIEKELLELRERIKDRHLTVNQSEGLLKLLADAPRGAIKIECVGGQSPEPCIFAEEIEHVLKKAGWNTVFSGGAIKKETLFQVPAGLRLMYGDISEPRALALQRAFIIVGIEISIVRTGDNDQISLQLGARS